jgi:hypothetical protein
MDRPFITAYCKSKRIAEPIVYQLISITRYVFALVMLHFAKRELETLLSVILFAVGSRTYLTMPIS